MTAEETRKMLGLKSVQTIYRWANKGWIRKIILGTRTVRFDSKEINNITTNGLIISNTGKPRKTNARGLRSKGKRLWEE